jgi:hypothetical protein
MTPHLEAAKVRRDAMRELVNMATGCIAAGNLSRALHLADTALHKLSGVKLLYKPDAEGLDAIIACLAVAVEVAKYPARAGHLQVASELLRKAVRMRVYSVTGRGLTSA